METSRVSHSHGQVQLLTFVKPPCWARALQVRTARTVQSAAAAEPAAVQTFSAGSLRRQRATHGRPCQAREPAGRAAPGRVSKQSIEQNATAAVIRRWVACMAGKPKPDAFESPHWSLEFRATDDGRALLVLPAAHGPRPLQRRIGACMRAQERTNPAAAAALRHARTELTRTPYRAAGPGWTGRATGCDRMRARPRPHTLLLAGGARPGAGPGSETWRTGTLYATVSGGL